MALIAEINSKPQVPKEAVKLIKKKLLSQQPKSIFLALIVTEKAMQKCGSPLHTVVGTKEFMNVMIQMLQNRDLQKEVMLFFDTQLLF